MENLSLSTKQRSLAAVAIAALATAASSCSYIEPNVSDANFYRAMALGQPALKPFANRVLTPWLARHIAGIGHLSIDHAFGIVALASLFLFFFVLSLFLLRLHAVIPGVFVAAIAMPFAWTLYYDALLPDALHAAIVIVYLYLLFQKRWLFAALLLIPMFLARESSLLLVVIAVIVLWKQHRSAAWMQVGGTVLSLAASHFAVSGAAGNSQGLSEPVYLIAKVPWNLARQLGFAFWVDTYGAPVPAHTWQLPALFHSHRIGLFPWIAMVAESTTAIFFGCFGLGALLLARLLYLRGRNSAHGEAWLRIAFWYGLVSFLLAPALGTNTYRLASYAWPLFFLWIPFTLATLRLRAGRGVLALLLFLHVAAAMLFVPQTTMYIFHATGTLPSLQILSALMLVVLLAAAPFLFRLRTGNREENNP